MSSGIVDLREKFKTIYDKLEGKYVGYIQMSDKRIVHVYTTPEKLWGLDALYVDVKGNKTEVNYVLEMVLFSEVNESILVRQHNDGWLEKTVTIDDTMPTDNFYTVTPNTPKIKIAQIWEEEPNEFCLQERVLELKCLMFAGFEKEISHDKSTL